MSMIRALIEELEQAKQKCPYCGGSGVVTTPEWEEYWKLRLEVEKRIQAENPDKPRHLIEQQVYEEIEHLLPEVDEETTCIECEGKGYVLTDDALELICLLRGLGL